MRIEYIYAPISEHAAASDAGAEARWSRFSPWTTAAEAAELPTTTTTHRFSLASARTRTNELQLLPTITLPGGGGGGGGRGDAKEQRVARRQLARHDYGRRRRRVGLLLRYRVQHRREPAAAAGPDDRRQQRRRDLDGEPGDELGLRHCRRQRQRQRQACATHSDRQLKNLWPWKLRAKLTGN